MKININKPLVFFDLETTGVDISRDRVVEISYIRLTPDGAREEECIRVNPTIPIPSEASEVHGIYDEDVKDCPTFRELAPQLQEIFEGADIAGFNSNHFDVPVLVEEFLRAGVDINLRESQFIDVQNIYHKLERRTLSAAYQFYCGKDLTNAHNALADAKATLEVLEAQLDKYPEELQNNVNYLSDYSQRNRNVDFAGRIVYDDKGKEIINFGKYKGRSVEEVVLRDPGFLNWIQQADFTLNTKRVFEQLKWKYAKR